MKCKKLRSGIQFSTGSCCTCQIVSAVIYTSKCLAVKTIKVQNACPRKIENRLKTSRDLNSMTSVTL
ncbi:FAD-dependent urate hydroxylase [Dirofilaria immitis]